MTEQSAKKKVGALLFLGILFLPIAFAWLLVRRGYSVRARVISFAWLVLGLGFIFAVGSQPDRGATMAESLVQAPAPQAAYVTLAEIEVRDAPDGRVVNKFYRGQRVDIHETDGNWVRVSETGFDARWLRRSDLSDTPAPSAITPSALDPRLAALPLAGEYGHTQVDIEALRTAALQLLASGECVRIEDGNKSVNVAGLYYVDCGEASHRFFRVRDGAIHFCGSTADECSQ